MNRLLAIVCAGTLAALISLQSVQAHAAPAKISPGDGAVLVTSPSKIVIEMSQDMARQDGGNDIDVVGPDGTEVTTEAAVIDNANRRLLSVNVPANLPPGKYVIRWKSLSSDDGDPADGELSFTVDPAGPAQPGREILREELGGSPTPATNTDSASAFPTVTEPDGVTWVLVVAVGVGALVLGAGGTFLLVDKRQVTPPTKSKGNRK
ncbi:MAG: hypothetical protein DYG91_05320 [Chloroflexi bacterium CFX7]|nr:hypothetical protein [Chloroflexi bacterium CFX7]RIL01849.1 MAG: hypothetical protein DCC78_09325 [bacterium]